MNRRTRIASEIKKKGPFLKAGRLAEKDEFDMAIIHWFQGTDKQTGWKSHEPRHESGHEFDTILSQSALWVKDGVHIEE